MFVSISFWPSGTISNACIMFVDQFRQSVDLYSSPNSRLVIKTEYKEIEKHWHIFILISFKCIRNDFRSYRLLITSFTFLLLNFENGSLYMLQTVTVEN